MGRRPTTPSDTTLAAGTECIGANFTAATRQFASNTNFALQRERVFAAPTWSFASATGTITTGINVDIADPVVGANAAITNIYSLRAANVLFTGVIKAGAGPTTLTDAAGKILAAALNTVGPTVGGTGLTSYAQGDLLYASATNTLAALAKDANSTRYLSNTGASNAPAWAQIGLTTGVTGILPGANGGTANGFFAVSGPTTSLKTFAFPDASATVLTTNAAVTVAQGGTGIASGTSGGIPYFSGTTTIASSTLLAANALVIGGGAGTAPSTTTTGTGVLTALGVNVGSAGAFVTFNGALGTPSSGTVTNLTGTASININGTVGATTPAAGTFTALVGTSGTHTGITSLGIRDTSAAFDVTLAATSSVTLGAGRTLTFDVANAARTLKLTGNPTLADWFDQAVKAGSSPTFVTVTAALTGNASTATALATTRSIYGNNFDGTAALAQIIASTFGSL